MLKKRDLHDAPILFPLLNDQAVKPYVREKAETIEEYYFFLNKMMIQEENGELISRTIVDEWDAPIGAITLYDIQDQMGFLATWIGKPYFGKGYNQYAKDLFLRELFLEKDIEVVFLKVNKVNERSLNAKKKLNMLFMQVSTTQQYMNKSTVVPKNMNSLRFIKMHLFSTYMNKNKIRTVNSKHK